MGDYNVSHVMKQEKYTTDFPPGFGVSSDFSKKYCSEFVHYTPDFPPGFGSNVPGPGRVGLGEGFGNWMDYHWRRRAGAVKSKAGECDRIRVKKECKKIVGKEVVLNDDGARDKKLESLDLFKKRFDEISRKDEDVKRVDCRALKELKDEGVIKKGFCSRIGAVPGVEVGDKFDYRVELVIVGLHGRYEHGIDYIGKDDNKLATCIVATEGHLDRMRDANVLTYVGEGGKSRCVKSGVVKDQKKEGGNRALWNSMKRKTPVRVVKGFKKDAYDRVRGRTVQRMKYIYDGLYEVTDCEAKKGPLGNSIFEFKLLRRSGQPTIPMKENCKQIRF